MGMLDYDKKPSKKRTSYAKNYYRTIRLWAFGSQFFLRETMAQQNSNVNAGWPERLDAICVERKRMLTTLERSAMNGFSRANASSRVQNCRSP